MSSVVVSLVQLPAKSSADVQNSMFASMEKQCETEMVQMMQMGSQEVPQNPEKSKKPWWYRIENYDHSESDIALEMLFFPMCVEYYCRNEMYILYMHYYSIWSYYSLVKIVTD